MRIMNAKSWLLISAAAFGFSVGAAAADISGAGATFPYPIYAKWADAYKTLTGVGLNYQSIGSGGGIKQIKAKTVTFGASDMPLKPQDLSAAGLLQFPMIIGGVVPVVNIKGIQGGQLHLDGATVASIYLGDITQWNDPKIKALNPKLALPDTAIAPVPYYAPTGRERTSCSRSISPSRARNSLRASAPTLPCNGRPASAPRATRALPT